MTLRFFVAIQRFLASWRLDCARTRRPSVTAYYTGGKDAQAGRLTMLGYAKIKRSNKELDISGMRRERGKMV
jgi:hypothetical protein